MKCYLYSVMTTFDKQQKFCEGLLGGKDMGDVGVCVEMKR